MSTIADRIGEVAQQGEQMGVRTDDETMARMLLMVAGRGNAGTETLRAWTVDEVRNLV